MERQSDILRWHSPQSHSNKKLCCRRETARRFVSLNILLSHSRSLKVIRNDTVEYGICKSLLVSIETMSASRTVSEIFSIKEWHDLETGARVVQSH